jgi:hypothetical protein
MFMQIELQTLIKLSAYITISSLSMHNDLSMDEPLLNKFIL